MNHSNKISDSGGDSRSAIAPRLLTEEQARAALGGISRTTMHRMMVGGRIRVVKLGRLNMVPVEEIDRVIAALPAAREVA
ncbi:helix-turn-helix domain-containing protein [uncultured Alsobacter sp.]|uniref:helix-turn-helix domain-containing protein n=1 Tax=uncultured Alsobacter sp. TaxID=1748258 RepID=UPI0025EBF756|nr:helix-turn-helix domain-containing protein [uncultured Alsobacter sp.]